ncbi:hypothetical protein MMC26_003153 [Xylographa opegraphella]|nr:hypothetical protein [Xylographa opegraphella]
MQSEETVLYSKSFFAKELATSRKLLLYSLLVPLLYETLTIWGTASLYYGSTTSTNLKRLTVYAVDLDGAFLGQQMIGAIKASLNSTPNPLGWQFDDSVNSDTMSRALVTDEQAWAVIQGRRASILGIAMGSLVLPAVLGIVNPLLADFGAMHTGTFLEDRAGNATAVEIAVQCPVCLASPFAAQQIDLHPFDVPTASGSVTVGLIFVSEEDDNRHYTNVPDDEVSSF